jgi:heme o synthase
MSIGITSASSPLPRSAVRARLADYVELTKLRIVVMELATVLATLHVASRGDWQWGLALALVVGTALVAGSASTLNQWLEQEQDAVMVRTRNRPLPAGRLSRGEVLALGLVMLAVGFTILLLGVNQVVAAIAAATWVIYVALYTPLKTRSTFNTTVGAVSGALPILMGWFAGGGDFGATAIGLFTVLAVWQFPHFMAIAWLCRDDYQRAGYRMSSTADPTGASCGWQAIVGSVLLVPAALILLWDISSPTLGTLAYVISAAVLAGLMLRSSLNFHHHRTDQSARTLMRVSLLYLPLWLLAFVLWC